MHSIDELPEEYKTLIRLAILELEEMQKIQPDVRIDMPIYGLYLIISALQLALRHPGLKGMRGEATRDITKQLHGIFPELSAVYQLLDLGWHENRDITIEISEPQPNSKYELMRAIAESFIKDLNASDPYNEYEIIGEFTLDSDDEIN